MIVREGLSIPAGIPWRGRPTAFFYEDAGEPPAPRTCASRPRWCWLLDVSLARFFFDQLRHLLCGGGFVGEVFRLALAGRADAAPMRGHVGAGLGNLPELVR